MDELARLLDDALAAGLGSAAALSVGDAGVEVGRLLRGRTRRPADPGVAPVPSIAPRDDEGPLWITEVTPFDLASLTKPMATAALAMVLVGDGALDLDAPIRRWFPGAASHGTVGQLLGHAAGCVAHVELFRALAADPPEDPYAALVARAAAEPAEPPGVRAVYSDMGYLVLGAIVERAAGLPLDQAFRRLVAEPLGLGGAGYPGGHALADAVSTELDERGLVTGRVHDENAYFGGGICGHAGLFATIGEVAAFAQAVVDCAAGQPRGRWRPEVVRQFVTTAAAPGTSWRLGWDTPSATPGVSHAGDRWPRTGAIGHTGFTGTSLWLDLPRRRWVALLTNRVHPTRHGTADGIKALRRAVGDAVVSLLGD